MSLSGHGNIVIRNVMAECQRSITSKRIDFCTWRSGKVRRCPLFSLRVDLAAFNADPGSHF